jgi:tetratricopeptide (TPR) repeat protein
VWLSNPRDPFPRFRVEVDPQRLDELSKQLRDQFEQLRTKAEQGLLTTRHTKVRLRRDGKQILPDLPLAGVLAGQGLTFLLLSPLTALFVNLGAKFLLEVELIHEADDLVEKATKAYLDGELDAAEALCRQALAMKPDDPAALFQLGTVLRVSGRAAEAEATLSKAAMGAEGHPDVVRAAEALARMRGKRTL